MSCQHLVCASCAGPVIDGRCATCRAARAEIHHPGFTLSPQLALLLAALLTVLLVVALHLS